MSNKKGISYAARKAKGRETVQEVIKLIRSVFPELGEDDVFKPTGSVPGEDIVFSTRGRELLPISIEVKRQESLNIWEALEQCNTNAKEYIPVVMFRRNKTKLYAAIEAEQLIALLRMRMEWEKEIK
jgi:hypothetical protein